MRRALRLIGGGLLAAWRFAMLVPVFTGLLLMVLGMFLARGPREAGILFDRLTY